jgi:hypothetical protein
LLVQSRRGNAADVAAQAGAAAAATIATAFAAVVSNVTNQLERLSQREDGGPEYDEDEDSCRPHALQQREGRSL